MCFEVPRVYRHSTICKYSLFQSSCCEVRTVFDLQVDISFTIDYFMPVDIEAFQVRYNNTTFRKIYLNAYYYFYYIILIILFVIFYYLLYYLFQCILLF